MTTETQILQELVEAVSRPDWWAIGITAVNAVIVIVLTLWQLCLNKRQTQIQERQNELQAQQVKLQEQQNRQQDYEVYRRMYALIREINCTAKSCISTIYNFLSIPLFSIHDKDYLGKYVDDNLELEKNLADTRVDFELRLSQNLPDIDKYAHLLAAMHSVLQHINLLHIEHIAVVQEDEERKRLVLFATNKYKIENVIDKISERIVDEGYRREVKDELIKLNKDIDEVLAMDTLGKIRERCKVE